MKNGLEMMKESAFKSKFSQGNDERFEFQNYEKNDSSRMKAVRRALQSYYDLMEAKEPEFEDEQERNEHQAAMAREKTGRLQLIVTNCNRYRRGRIKKALLRLFCRLKTKWF